MSSHAPRPEFEAWHSRASAAAARTPSPDAPPAQPVVAFRRDPDDGPRWHVRLGAYPGPERGNRLLAAADADALAAALAGPLGVAARVAALLASPEARDAVAGRCAAPASAALAVLRWCSEGPATGGEGDAALQWGDAPTLDRLITGAGVALVCGEEGE